MTTSLAWGADDKAACLDAVSKGQTLRDEHKLVEARAQFRMCARSQCPSVVQSDCAGFLDAVERNLPSVVFTAKDGAGAEMTDVQVTADGQPLVTKLDGDAVAMNPGPHSFVFASGGATAKKSATILEGSKNQIVSATLIAPPPAPVASAPPPTPATPPPQPPPPSTPDSAGSKGALVVADHRDGGRRSGAGDGRGLHRPRPRQAARTATTSAPAACARTETLPS